MESRKLREEFCLHEEGREEAWKQHNKLAGHGLFHMQ
jgi:hypothetical protein